MTLVLLFKFLLSSTVAMPASLFSLGNEDSLKASETDDYLKAKFAKAKAKTKAKAKHKKTSLRPAQEHMDKVISASCSGQATDDDLEDAERELLGLACKASAAPEAEDIRSGSEGTTPLPLDAGPAVRLAASGTHLASRRCCPEGHGLVCYAVGWSAGLCDNCDFMQKPGDVIFGCKTCDSELCATCAVETAPTPEDAKEHLELIARVTRLSLRQRETRFVATPSGALLDTAPRHAVEADKSSASSGPRRKQANEVDESDWRQCRPSNGYGTTGDVSQGGRRREVLGEFLAEQGRLIQRRHFRQASPSGTYRDAATAATTAGQQEAQEINLMDENAARLRPAWATGADTSSLTMMEESCQMERTFHLTLTLAGDFVDELARGYAQPWFQELIRKCAEECSYDRERFLLKLQDVAFEVQRPILENWGFEGNEQGLFDMTSILLEHSLDGGPIWLQEKVDRCLMLLYGGSEAGMLEGVPSAAAAIAPSKHGLSQHV
eukprot:TRINITY_DN18093_c0_g1_i1.p1 TRINITY_DN18093_c0_g1~~TRINITY_DN18093_c0_g1_i1.p1  ORF type:complete len:494 (-),score=122.37 TRINITY_DN18093_c0_g1_i1:70-1551(-)